MSTLGLIIVVNTAWILEICASSASKQADAVRCGDQEASGAVSIFPSFPFCPIFFCSAAWLVDFLVPPWGTRVVFWLHVALLLACFVSLARDTWTIRSVIRKNERENMKHDD